MVLWVLAVKTGTNGDHMDILKLENPTVEELKTALLNSALVIAAQATELVVLKESNDLYRVDGFERIEEISKLRGTIDGLRKQVRDLKREHIATTKAVRQKAVAYMNEAGQIVLIGQVAFKQCSYISGRDRLINDSWKPLGFIPKIDDTEV